MNAISPASKRPANRAPELVKSAVRVLEVLEFFDATRSPACVGAVATTLGFPQSSTSALLRSLTKVGYLRYDAHARTYMPTERVPLLGNWIGRSLFQGGRVLDMVEQLAQATGCTVVLARRTGFHAQYVYVDGSHCPAPPGVKIGAVLDLPGCAAGQVLLAGMPDAEIRRMLHRLNAEAPPGQSIRAADLLAHLAEVRASGVAVAADPLCTVLAVRLSLGNESDANVLGLAGTGARIGGQANALLAIVQEKMRTCLQPARRTLASFDVPAPFALPAARRSARHAPN